MEKKLMTKEEYEQMKKSEASREFSDKKLGAIDYLWSPQSNLQKYRLVGNKPRVMKEVPTSSNASENFSWKNEKVKGIMVYFIPRDEKGNPKEPKKYLQLENKNRGWVVFIDGESVEPYWIDVYKKKGEGYGASELAEARKRLGFDKQEPMMIASKFSGDIDVSNAEGLDDSIVSSFTNESLLSANGMRNRKLRNNNKPKLKRKFKKAKAKRTAPKLVKNELGKWVNQGTFNQDDERIVKAITFVNSIKNGRRAKLLIFTDNTASLAPFWNKVKENYSNLTNESLLAFTNESLLNADGDDYSNLTNESLLGADGYSCFTNESLLNADGDEYSNLTNESLLCFTNESLLNANGDDEYSNGIGSWFKSKFGKKKQSALAKIADPNTDIVTAQTMEQAHKESGSTKPLKEWISSDGGRNFLNSLTQIASILINQPKSTDKVNTVVGRTEEGKVTIGNVNETPEKQETKILGMNPVTFGVVAVGVIAVASIVTVKLIKR